jgi:hypothetical protein
MALNDLRVLPAFGPIFREIGLDAEAVFEHPQIIPWRSLPDRQNCTLDAELIDGRHIRWHIKRYAATNHPQTPAEHDVEGQRLLESEDIPTAPLIAWGRISDGRSFVIFEDLAGYEPADKLLEKHFSFDALLQPTADLAAKLHHAGLHHRDLYLCHFMAKVEGNSVHLKLIDTARVRRLPGVLTRRRWIVKDLAQFWYSTLKLPINDAQRDAWLQRYAGRRGLPTGATLRPSILRKVRQITRHDVKLNRERPSRNVSIPH